jgi:hypothetical protein
MARMVQRGEVTVFDSLLQPYQEDQRRFHKHRDHPSDELGIVLTVKLAKSLEHDIVEHRNTGTRFLCHQLPADVG